ncbi:MAG: LEPR-XLL domain-containing protein, partial [Pseudomonadota bacterium]|nr:LEPR-XLL domain-containing protein [Pseudomonadota bacterium]
MATRKSNIKKNNLSRLIRDAFRVEPLEPRVLLSADPVFGAAQVFLPDDHDNEEAHLGAYDFLSEDDYDQPAQPFVGQYTLDERRAEPANQSFSVDGVAWDLAQIAQRQSFMDGALQISAGQILKGSGSIEVALVNAGTVSPGYSPGIQNVASYIQDAAATLEMEVGGLGAGTGYDQLNVAGLATLDGTLTVTLIDGFVPNEGDTFDIINFGSVSGRFDTGTGFLSTDSNIYFEVVERADGISLIAHTLSPATGYVLDRVVGESADALGRWFNFGYFQDIAPITFAGSLVLDGGFYLDGQITLGYDADETLISPVDGLALEVDYWQLAITGASGFLGLDGPASNPGAIGVTFSDADFGLIFVQPTAQTADYGWALGEGTLGSIAALGLADLSLTGSNLAFAFNQGYGTLPDASDNTSVLNFSSGAYSVGGFNLDDDGSRGEYLLFSGSVSMGIGAFDLSGMIGISKVGNSLLLAGQDVNASFAASGLAVGIANGEFGMAITAAGIAFEGGGGLFLSGGGFADFSAEGASIRFNQTNLDYTGQTLDFAGDFHYTFARLGASASLQAASVVGLSANLGDSLVLGGDFAFEINAGGDGMNVVAANASAQVRAGGYSVGVQGASLGLSISASGRVLEAEGALSANLGELASLSADTVVVRWNETASDMSGVTLEAADLSYTFKSDLVASLQEVAIGGASLQLGGLLMASGSLAVRRDAAINLSLADGSSVTADRLTLGGANLSGQAGLNLDSADFFGFALSDLNFAFALYTDTSDASRQWQALKADAGSVVFSGIDGLTLAADSLMVEYNAASLGEPVADFSAGIDILVAPGETVSLDMDGAKGELLQARGNLEIDLFGFFQVAGGFAIEKGTDNVTLADGVVVEVDLLTIGASGVDAFAGVGGGSADAVGLQLQGVEFGLALASDKLTPSRSWTALQASAADVAFVGIDGLTVAADSVDVAINQAASDGSLIDWLARPLSVATGPADSLTLALDGSRGELLRASGNLDLDLFGFVQLSGGFAFEKTTADIRLDDGSDLTIDLLAIGGSGVDAFAGLNGGTADALGLELQQVDFGLALMREQTAAGVLGRSWSALQASAGEVAFVGVDGLTLAAREIDLAINQAASDGSVVDFAAGPLEITTGPGASIVLDLDGQAGPLLEAAGHLEVDLFGFVQFEGDLALRKAQAQVTLGDGTDATPASQVDVDLLTLGGADITAFAGLNGGTVNALGLALGGVEFGLAIASERTLAPRKWTSLQASADSAAFIGVDGLTLAGDSLGIAINQAAADGSLIDYAAQALTVRTGPGSQIDLDLAGTSGPLLQASGNLQLDLFGFVQASGGFAIEKTRTQITLADTDDNPLTPAEQVEVDLLAIGGSGIDAFAGLNGGTSNALGLALGEVDFGLALLSDRADPARGWTSLKATAGSIGFIGVEGFALSATDLSLEINRANQIGLAVVDYAAQGLALATGPDSVLSLDFAGDQGELLRAAGHLEIDVFSFVQVEGDFAFEKSSGQITLDTGETLTVDRLTVGGNDVDAFAGMNGGTADALGLQLQQVDFGLALQSDRADPARNWTSLQATAGSVAFVGIDGLVVAADSLSIAVNQAATDGSVVDYVAQGLDIATGPSTVLSLDMAGEGGPLLQASGHLTLDVFGFFSVDGDFALEKTSRQVTLSDGVIVDVDLLALGGNDIDAFAGLNGGSADAVGLSLGQADFALALMSEKTDASRKYTSLQASAGLAAFIGIDGLTIEASDLSVNVNQGVAVPAQAESNTSVNARWSLNLAGAAGTYTVELGADSAQIQLTGRETNLALVEKLSAALESLDGIGAGNVAITGNRIAGYDLEFIGALAGQDIAGLTVGVAAADISAAVSQTQAAQSGIDEIKRIGIESQRAAPAAIDLSISQIAAASLGGNEIKILLFTTPYSTKGLYDLALSSDPADKVSVRFVQNDIINNKNNIRAGIADLLNVGEGSIVVTFDNNSPSGHRYNIEFLGALGGTDIPDLIVTENLAGDILPLNVQQGGGGNGEIQRVLIDTAATGSFTLSLAYNGQTHTTTALAFGASAATVQSALNTALAGIGGSTT